MQDETHPVGRADLAELLRETRAVAEENNRILKSMRRWTVIGFIGKTFLWLVILGVPLFFIGPYLDTLMRAFQTFTNAGAAGTSSPGTFGLPSKEQIDQAIRQYKAQEGR
jgi:hypothetical protein